MISSLCLIATLFFFVSCSVNPVDSNNSKHSQTNGNTQQAIAEEDIRAALELNDLSKIMDIVKTINQGTFKIDGKSMLLWAIENKKQGVVEILLQNNADPTEGLTAAFDSDQARIIIMLVQAGARLDQKSFNGQEPLAWAASKGKYDGFLFKFGIKHPQRVKIDGKSFLEWAIDNRNFSLAEELVLNNADFNMLDERGNTILCVAVIENAGSLFRAVLTKNPELVNKRCETGKTPLHLAYELQRNGLIAELRNNGADQHLRDEDYKLPSDYKDFLLVEDLERQLVDARSCKVLFLRVDPSLKKAYRVITKRLHPDQCSHINSAIDCRTRNKKITDCKAYLGI